MQQRAAAAVAVATITRVPTIFAAVQRVVSPHKPLSPIYPQSFLVFVCVRSKFYISSIFISFAARTFWHTFFSAGPGKFLLLCSLFPLFVLRAFWLLLPQMLAKYYLSLLPIRFT